MRSPIDPTLAFICIVLAVPPLKMDNVADVVAYVLDPHLLLAVAVTAALYLWGQAQKVQLTYGQQLRANWFLLNGPIVHVLWDFGVGVFHVFPGLDKQYKILDNRFITESSVPAIVGTVEATVMAPLCLLTYYALKKDHPLRQEFEVIISVIHAFVAVRFLFTEVIISVIHAFGAVMFLFTEVIISVIHAFGAVMFLVTEVIISVIHAFGAVMFLFTEVWDGLPNVPHDPFPGFSVHQLLYYWFGFWFCNLVWIAVPYFIVRNALEENYRLKTGQAWKKVD